ncbi:MAG: hypothetical protein JXR68_00950 [Bacteroidales bacterium]|nr:hypothetical protein [Bacteroidales bacterium]
MAKKNKNTEKSTFAKSITNLSGIWSFAKYIWILLLPLFILMSHVRAYKIDKQQVEISVLSDSIKKMNKSVDDLTEKNKVLNNNLMATSAQLDDLKSQFNIMAQKLQQTTSQYSNYKANINDDLNELKSDLYRINMQINSLQQKLLGTQRQGQGQ